jgi:hypothetical protein
MNGPDDEDLPPPPSLPRTEDGDLPPPPSNSPPENNNVPPPPDVPHPDDMPNKPPPLPFGPQIDRLFGPPMDRQRVGPMLPPTPMNFPQNYIPTNQMPIIPPMMNGYQNFPYPPPHMNNEWENHEDIPNTNYNNNDDLPNTNENTSNVEKTIVVTEIREKKISTLKRKTSGLVPTSVRMKKKKVVHENNNTPNKKDDDLASLMADISSLV